MRATGASRIYVPTWPRTNVPKAYQLFIFTSQGAKVAITVPIFNLACQHAKGVLIFQLRLLKNVQIFQQLFKRIF